MLPVFLAYFTFEAGTLPRLIGALFALVLGPNLVVNGNIAELYDVRMGNNLIVATQIDFHARFGGVVPEIASRKHTEAIVGLFEETMARAGAHFGCDTLVS